MRVRVLAIDPGAERLGWAVLDRIDGGIPVLHASGIWGLSRKPKEDFQPYKLRLISYWSIKAPMLLRQNTGTRLISEILPAVGGGNFAVATQSELAKAAITVIQAFAMKALWTVEQIGATTIKKAIGGSKTASKAKVRNGVIHFLPDLKDELKTETTGSKPVWDRSDAIATGLTYYGLALKQS